MKILVTGGAGFIGSALIRKLVNNTAHHVLNYDSLTYSGNLSSLNSIDQSDRYTFVHGDICDPEVFRSTLDNFRPQKIINLAAESHVDRSIDNPFPFFQTNVLGTLNLLHISNEYFQSLDISGKKDFIFHHVSTDEVYGDIPLDCLPCDEQYPYQPSSPYAASKASSDHFVRAYYETYGLKIKISNCSNNYGSHQFPEKLIPLIINNIVENNPLPIYGKGDNIRDWLHVIDHAEAIDLIFHKGEIGETFNIGGHNEKQNIELVHLLIKLVDQKLGRKEGESLELITYVKDRAGHDQRYAIDAEKLQNILGWTPKYTVEKGIEETVNWFLSNKDWINNIISCDYLNYYEGQYAKR